MDIEGDKIDILAPGIIPLPGIVSLRSNVATDSNRKEPRTTPKHTNATIFRTRVNSAVQTVVEAGDSDREFRGREQRRYGWSTSPTKYQHHNVSDENLNNRLLWTLNPFQYDKCSVFLQH